MKKSFLTLALLCCTITTLVAQEIAPSKNKFGVILSTNIFGFNDDDFNKVDVKGGFYFAEKYPKDSQSIPRLMVQAAIMEIWH